MLFFLSISMSTAGSSLLFGFRTADASVITSTGIYENSGGVVINEGYRYITPLGDDMVVGIIGDLSDCNLLRVEMETANVEHKLSYGGASLQCEAMANLCRSIIAKYLRRANPLNVECMIAGCDSEGDPKLFWLDSIGSIQNVPFGAFGKDSAIILSALDRCQNEFNLLQVTETSGFPSESRMVLDELLDPSNTRYAEETPYSVSDVLNSCWNTIRRRSNTLAPIGSCHVLKVTKKGVQALESM
jgi:20S proteasome alpha/beta subunit